MKPAAILKDATPEQLESFVQLAVLVAFADGTISQEEEAVLVRRVTELTDGRVDSAHVQSLMVELPPLSRESNNWRADRIKMYMGALSDKNLRAEVFRLAVDVAASDNGIGVRESRMLVNLVNELELSSEQVKSILGQKPA